MLPIRLGSYGHTVLPAEQLKLLAREALSGQSHSKEVEVFFMDTPHSGGNSISLTVTFDPSDADDIVIGHLDSEKTLAFFLRNPAKEATFIFLEEM